MLISSAPMSQGVIQGTVPYLGTFLTDLVMLDTAMKDYLYVSEPRSQGGVGRALKPEWRAPPHPPRSLRPAWPLGSPQTHLCARAPAHLTTE